jgi:hypothetical protein
MSCFSRWRPAEEREWWRSAEEGVVAFRSLEGGLEILWIKQR